MGKVNYKFAYESEIGSIKEIWFGDVSIDLVGAEKLAHLLEGEVDGVEPDPDGKLRVFVSLSGEPGQTWRLSGVYSGREQSEFLVEGKIDENGVSTKKIKVGTNSGGPNIR